MRKVSRIEPAVTISFKRKKVAAYARVSRNTQRLMHSVSAQISHYRAVIRDNPQWEYAGVYADCGISGTGMEKRSGFQRMLADCEAGKIDIILTKSISRFARNTVDLLNTVRHLRTLGIEVRFEKEHISSLSKEGELMLSLLASFAQEESKSISENCKWGIRRRFESGEIGTANKHILGYQYDEEEKLYKVIPGEAETVREIFAMYLKGRSLRQIADTLNGQKITTAKGSAFTKESINAIVHNEVYAGDIRRQKCFTEDPITKGKTPNRGELAQYYTADCHEAILDRRTWAAVQAEAFRRALSANPTYPFTGKIRCGICGNLFTRKIDREREKTYVYWICRSKKEKGRTCASVNVGEERLKAVTAQAMGAEAFEEEAFEAQVEEMVVTVDGDLEFYFRDGRVGKRSRKKGGGGSE